MTITLEQKYGKEIACYLRQRRDLEPNDTSEDAEIAKMSKEDVLYEVCSWNGLLGGWSHTIKCWIKAIYGVDLDNFDNSYSDDDEDDDDDE